MDQPPNKHTVFVDSEQEAEVRVRLCVWTITHPFNKTHKVQAPIPSNRLTPSPTLTFGHTKQRTQQAFEPAAHFETVPELATRAFNRPRKGTLEVRETR